MAQDKPGFDLPDAAAILATPTHFVDANFGVATAFGVARITFGAFKYNSEPDATAPVLHPVVTIAIAEQALLQFAHDVIDRAAQAGIVLDEANG